MRLFGNATRREFLKKCAALSAVGSAAPLTLNLQAIGKSVANNTDDFKALVCVFLYGGNDQFNTLVPFDTENHHIYTKFRGDLATEQHILRATALENASLNGVQYALAPQMTGMHRLWKQSNAGVLLNVGPLIEPTTKKQYKNKSVELPRKLFSHNDQQTIWQTLINDGDANGWGGRLADLVLNKNENDEFSCISLRGNNVFLSGESVLPYSVSAEGVPQFNAHTKNEILGSSEVANAIMSLMSAPDNHLIKDTYASIVKRSVGASDKLQQALDTTPAMKNKLPKTKLGGQLSMVAKIIASREALGIKRQIFMVGIGGFDNHDSLIDNHPALLTEVDEAISAFYKVTEELSVENSVTTFTASDFGRTLTNNGDGTDHGWGSHHFIVGGAVNGSTYWGKAPMLGDNAMDDVGRGRLLPSTSADELASTLGLWFGASESELNLILPNLANFSNKSLSIFERA